MKSRYYDTKAAQGLLSLKGSKQGSMLEVPDDLNAGDQLIFRQIIGMADAEGCLGRLAQRVVMSVLAVSHISCVTQYGSV